jgi:hypothetical protein
MIPWYSFGGLHYFKFWWYMKAKALDFVGKWMLSLALLWILHFYCHYLYWHLASFVFNSVPLVLEPGWAGCALASLATELALSSQIKQCLVMLNLNVMALHTSHTINCCIDLLRCRRHYLSMLKSIIHYFPNCIQSNMHMFWLYLAIC